MIKKRHYSLLLVILILLFCSNKVYSSTKILYPLSSTYVEGIEGEWSYTLGDETGLSDLPGMLVLNIVFDKEKNIYIVSVSTRAANASLSYGLKVYLQLFKINDRLLATILPVNIDHQQNNHFVKDTKKTIYYVADIKKNLDSLLVTFLEYNSTNPTTEIEFDAKDNLLVSLLNEQLLEVISDPRYYPSNTGYNLSRIDSSTKESKSHKVTIKKNIELTGNACVFSKMGNYLKLRTNNTLFKGNREVSFACHFLIEGVLDDSIDLFAKNNKINMKIVSGLKDVFKKHTFEKLTGEKITPVLEAQITDILSPFIENLNVRLVLYNTN